MGGMKYIYQKSDKPSVSIVIVTYNGAEYMDGLCSSLLKAAKVPIELIVVDNASSDATTDIIRRYFPEAKIFALDKNIGFGRACNLGAGKARGEYLFFLNQDTEVAPEAVISLFNKANENKDVGLVGAKMKFANCPEVINSFGHAMNRIGFAWDYGAGEIDNEKFSREREVLSVCGGAFLIRRNLFLSLGGFDKKFFMYGEDVDLGLRAVAAGYKAVVTPEAVVFHYKNIFSANTRHLEFLEHRNRWRRVLKYFPCGLLGEAVRGGMKFDLISFFRFLFRGELNRFFYRSMAIISAFISLPEIIWQRTRRVKGDFLSNKITALIREGRKPPEIDVGYLFAKRQWSANREKMFRELLKREKIASPSRVLFLRGPQPEMLTEMDMVLKEIYPQVETVMLVADKRRIGGFTGTILDLPYSGNIIYFFKLWSKIFRKFDLILIFRENALFKKILALAAFPKASFTIDDVGRLEKVSVLRILREVNPLKLLFSFLSHVFKKIFLRLIFCLGEVVFFMLGLRRKKLKKILFIQMGQLGDLVLETAGVEAIKKKFPEAKIISLVGPWGEEWVRRDPLIDKVIVYDASWIRPSHLKAGRGGRGLFHTLIALWRERIDLSIDFRGEANNIILAYLTGARLRLGYSLRSQNVFLPIEEVKFLLNLSCEYPWEKRHSFHQVEHNLRLLKKLGVRGDFKPRALTPSQGAKRERSEAKPPLVIVHPGASRIEKTWPAEKFSKLIERLQDEYGARVVLIGSAGEVVLGKTITGPLKEKPVVAIGKTTLDELTALISEADLFIGNESGPMHIAASLSIPTVAIMSGVPSLYGPYNTVCRVVQKKLPCWQPCIEHCYCPDDRYQCLKEIEVEDVWGAAKEII